VIYLIFVISMIFSEGNGLRLQRILTDRGTEYCGNIDRHEYQLFLANKGIKHTRTKPRSPQTNGICERFNRTFKDEFVSVVIEKENDEYILHQLDFMFANYGQRNEK